MFLLLKPVICGIKLWCVSQKHGKCLKNLHSNSAYEHIGFWYIQISFYPLRFLLTQQCLQHLFSTSFSAQDLILKHALKENVLPHNTMTNLEAIVQDIHHQHCPVSVSLLFLIILKSFPLEKYILFSGSYLPLHYLRSPLHI